MIEQPQPSRLGELVGGKYRIVRLLARGGMGVVYEAQHTVVKRRFAVKLLRPDLATRRDILGRFQREAEAAGALESENVAAAVDFGVADDGTPYIVMEYLVGESLGALLDREKTLPIGRAADLMAQACRGVQAAHAAGIVHRDLKPQNLFVCRREDGTDLVKVLDFGVAKLQALDELQAATRTGTVLGTAAYMSPEQARGDKEIDHRADVYALGAIVYELISGKMPHPGDSHNAVLHHIATQPAISLADASPGAPASLVAVVDRAVASQPEARPASAEALAQALAPFARREAWPAAPSAEKESRPGEQTSTVLASDGSGRSASGRGSGSPVTGRSTAPVRRRVPLVVGAGVALVAIGLVVAFVRQGAAPPPATSQAPRARQLGFGPETRFLNQDPPIGALQQIEALMKASAFRDAAMLNAMVATPSAFWFEGGSPQQVQGEVRGVVARGARQGRVPILVTYDLPFKDCTGYGVTGAADGAAYAAWIDGLADGIGNERAIVLLEPNSLGLMPYGVSLDGTQDRCRPTVASAEGKRVAPAGATAGDRFSQIAQALASIQRRAPNAAVYLDGTHSNWLPVGDAASRLAQAGVARAAGFFLNTGDHQPTARLVQYGTWIAKCLHHAKTTDSAGDATKPYRECASTPEWADTADDAIWSKVDAWYGEHVDHGPRPPKPEVLTHFVINTNRNGRGRLDVTRYAKPPYNQPPEVIEALRYGSWCMPPDRGLGLRPTADTGVPLVDAYLWSDVPGTSHASCDIAGGARAWNYSKYNPWGIAGDAQNHFDPLWGMVAPPPGAWFPEEALQLVRNADPPLVPAGGGHEAGEKGTPRASAGEEGGGAAPAEAAASPARPIAVRKVPAAASGRPRGRSADVRGANTQAHEAAEPSVPPPEPAGGKRAAGAAFDSDNPYK